MEVERRFTFLKGYKMTIVEREALYRTEKEFPRDQVFRKLIKMNGFRFLSSISEEHDVFLKNLIYFLPCLCTMASLIGFMNDLGQFFYVSKIILVLRLLRGEGSFSLHVPKQDIDMRFMDFQLQLHRVLTQLPSCESIRHLSLLAVRCRRRLRSTLDERTRATIVNKLVVIIGNEIRIRCKSVNYRSDPQECGLLGELKELSSQSTYPICSDIVFCNAQARVALRAGNKKVAEDYMMLARMKSCYICPCVEIVMMHLFEQFVLHSSFETDPNCSTLKQLLNNSCAGLSVATHIANANGNNEIRRLCANFLLTMALALLGIGTKLNVVPLEITRDNIKRARSYLCQVSKYFLEILSDSDNLEMFYHIAWARIYQLEDNPSCFLNHIRSASQNTCFTNLKWIHKYAQESRSRARYQFMENEEVDLYDQHSNQRAAHRYDSAIQSILKYEPMKSDDASNHTEVVYSRDGKHLHNLIFEMQSGCRLEKSGHVRDTGVQARAKEECSARKKEGLQSNICESQNYLRDHVEKVLPEKLTLSVDPAMKDQQTYREPEAEMLELGSVPCVHELDSGSRLTLGIQDSKQGSFSSTMQQLDQAIGDTIKEENDQATNATNSQEKKYIPDVRNLPQSSIGFNCCCFIAFLFLFLMPRIQWTGVMITIFTSVDEHSRTVFDQSIESRPYYQSFNSSLTAEDDENTGHESDRNQTSRKEFTGVDDEIIQRMFCQNGIDSTVASECEVVESENDQEIPELDLTEFDNGSEQHLEDRTSFETISELICEHGSSGTESLFWENFDPNIQERGEPNGTSDPES